MNRGPEVRQRTISGLPAARDGTKNCSAGEDIAMTRRTWLSTLLAIPGAALIAKAWSNRSGGIYHFNSSSTTGDYLGEIHEEQPPDWLVTSWGVQVPSSARDQTESFLDMITAHGANVHSDPFGGQRLYPFSTSSGSGGSIFYLRSEKSVPEYMESVLGHLPPSVLRQVVDYCEDKLYGAVS
jgi:hypothetical protein